MRIKKRYLMLNLIFITSILIILLSFVKATAPSSTMTANMSFNQTPLLNQSVNPKGLIPVGSGVPFYTNESNPRTSSSLGFSDSEVIVYWVNATSETGYVYDFFAFGNLTSDMSNSIVSEGWEVEVV